MSKLALKTILNQIVDSTSKSFRETVLNKETHIITITPQIVHRELVNAINLDSDVTQILSPADFNNISTIYYNNITKLMAPYAIKSKPGEYIVKATGSNRPYNIIASRFSQANKEIVDYINSILGRESRLNSSTLIQFDHRRTVSDTRIASYFNAAKGEGRQKFPFLLDLLKEGNYVTEQDYELLTELKSYYTSDGSKKFLATSRIQGDLESGVHNEQRGKTEVKERRNRIQGALQRALKDKNWAGQAGSDSKLEQVRKEVINTALKSIKGPNIRASTKPAKIDTSPNQVSSKNKIKQKSTIQKVRLGSKKKYQQRVQNPSYLSLVALFNARLPPVVRSFMVGGRLHNKSGRFSESVKIVNVETTEKGYPSFVYTYQRSPYDVFDPVLGKAPWNTPGRDPKTLIDVSIREVARNMALGRFYTRRA